MALLGHGVFSLQLLASVNDREEGRALEKRFIRHFQSLSTENGYNISSGGEDNYGTDNPRAKLTENDVIRVRDIYASRMTRGKDLWEKEFKSRISWSAFQKIWNGATWKNTHMDVYSPESVLWYKHQTALQGEHNPLSFTSDA